tara:strand:+ start:252 stop:545 length:294 start_codon:yes stop_codon:yes gene_type:complete
MRIIYGWIILMILAVGILLSGCSVLSALSTVDVISTITTGKATVDNVVSEVQGQDCAVHRAFKGNPVCKKSLLDRMLSMNCNSWKFDVKGNPYCNTD